MALHRVRDTQNAAADCLERAIPDPSIPGVLGGRPWPPALQLRHQRLLVNIVPLAVDLVTSTRGLRI
jgi:hypothetical protein